MNYSQKFASDTDYIFLSRNILQNTGLKQQINIAMWEVSGVSSNSGVLSNSCRHETVKQWVSSEHAFRFMRKLKELHHIAKKLNHRFQLWGNT